MKTKSIITSGVKVSAEAHYQEKYSSPQQSSYVYSYLINILNSNDFAVKLLRRHWYIYDSNGTIREVEGKGVIGRQPTINPGQSYEYSSACNLNTEIGKMYGSFLLLNLLTDEKFRVNVPEFHLIVPYKLN